MERFKKVTAWTLIYFGVALLVLGALGTPEIALGNGPGNPGPCIQSCYTYSTSTSCDQDCQSQCNGDPTCYSNCMQTCGSCVGACCMLADPTGGSQEQCCSGPSACGGNAGCNSSCLAGAGCPGTTCDGGGCIRLYFDENTEQWVPSPVPFPGGCNSLNKFCKNGGGCSVCFCGLVFIAGGTSYCSCG
jgi:hypothetical protein